MVAIDLTATGLDESINLIKNTNQQLREIQAKALREIAEKIISEAKSNLQNNTNINSGTLLASIKILEDQGDIITIGSDVDYAGYIEFGRGPIFPNDPDGVLHWVDKDTGEDVFAKSAGPFEAMPFFEPAVVTISNQVDNLVLEKVNKLYRVYYHG